MAVTPVEVAWAMEVQEGEGTVAGVSSGKAVAEKAEAGAEKVTVGTELVTEAEVTGERGAVVVHWVDCSTRDEKVEVPEAAEVPEAEAKAVEAMATATVVAAVPVVDVKGAPATMEVKEEGSANDAGL